MHYKGENHWKKLSLTAGIGEIVNNRELCIVFREKKAAKPGEKRSKSMVPEGSRGRGSRVQSSSCLVQEKASGRGSQWLQALPPPARVAAWSQALLGPPEQQEVDSRGGEPHRRPPGPALGCSTAASYTSFLPHGKFHQENIYSK